MIETYSDAAETSFELASRARYSRFIASKKAYKDAGKDFQYGIKEFIHSHGESTLFLGLLGSSKEGKIPLEYLRVLFHK